METRFYEQVNDALSLLRRNDTKALGQHELARLRVVQKRLPADTLDQIPPTLVGAALGDVLREVITILDPLASSASELDRRSYSILRGYVRQGRGWKEVADEQGIGRTAFFKGRELGVELVASELWQLEQDALQELAIVEDNLPRPPYTHFVERRDGSGRPWSDGVIDALTTMRGWVIIIDGPAGAGKTCLAYRVAKVCVERKLFEAVVWVSAKLRELSADSGCLPRARDQYVTSLSGILDTICLTVGNVRRVLTLSSIEEKTALTRQILAKKTCLVIIDNLEDLSDEVLKQVTAFLDHLPKSSKALLTSRRRHHVGEIDFQLTGMERDESFEFMRLQSELRRLRRPSPDDMRFIHRETAGIPLAMEYVLGQIAVFGHSAQQVVGPGATHQQLMRYMFEAAYFGELGDTEKEILHLVSLFVEPASVTAIRIAGDLGEAQTTVGLGNLYRLFFVDKLEQTEPARYSILPPMGRFLANIQEDDNRAEGKFNDAFIDAACERLVRYYINQLNMQGIDDQLRFLRSEKRNVTVMLEWCDEKGMGTHVIHLVQAVGRALGILGYVQDRMRLAQRAMHWCDEYQLLQEKIRFAITDLAWAYIRRGQIEEARAVLEENISLLEDLEFPYERALALHNLGRLNRNTGDYDTAKVRLREALAYWTRLEDREWQARTEAVLGAMEYELGNPSHARHHLEEALYLRRKVGHENEIVETLADLALVSLAEGNRSEAENLLSESMYRGEQLPGPGPSYAYALYRDAEMKRLLGNLERARESAQQAYRIFEDFGERYRAMEVEQFLSALDGGQ